MSLRLIPIWAWVVAAALGYGWFRGQQARTAEAKAQTVVVGVANARAEGLAQQLQQQEIINDAQRRAILEGVRARQTADEARRAAERSGSELQQRARDLAARACPAAAPAPGVGASGAAGPEVLADVLGLLEERARHYAALADDRRLRGLECQAHYDALRARSHGP